MILLDTHVLIWVDVDDPTLGKVSRRLLKQAWETGQISVSAITFWERAMLHARHRITLSESPLTWRGDLLATGLTEWPLDGETAILANELESLHKDPADRFIAATAIVHRATLVTADQRLLEWKHSVKRQDAAA
jgi:PIN domain nuclease of toxin-antitoxin system